MRAEKPHGMPAKMINYHFIGCVVTGPSRNSVYLLFTFLRSRKFAKTNYCKQEIDWKSRVSIAYDIYTSMYIFIKAQVK